MVNVQGPKGIKDPLHKKIILIDNILHLIYVMNAEEKKIEIQCLFNSMTGTPIKTE